MGNPFRSPSLKLMFVLSLSLSISSYSSLPLRQTFFSSSSSSPSLSPKSLASDLLSLLGPKDQASKVNSREAQRLKSCLRFLVPFSPNSSHIQSPTTNLPENGQWRRSMVGVGGGGKEAAENELIWWPPQSVLDLARLAVDSGGDPGAVHRTLDPTVLPVFHRPAALFPSSQSNGPFGLKEIDESSILNGETYVPDIEGSNEDRCQLTRTPYGRRFISEELNSYFAFLFEMIASRGPTVGLNVSLNRFDFFHGHLFIADSGRLGILFHAKEYPAYEKDVFPYNMGYCQIGSNVAYDDMMNLRNILWLAPLPNNASKAWVAPGVLVVLDARPGGIIYEDLVPEYVDLVRTIYEADFGDTVVDVNYLNVGETVADYQIFIC